MLLRSNKIKLYVLGGLLAVLAVSLAAKSWPREGCPAYSPSDGPLIAHAGGGLPQRTYANNLEALNLAARHGFTMIELDFMERGGRLTLGHDRKPESSLTVSGLMHWLDSHPGVSIVTDVKTDNVRGLELLKQAAGRRQARFIPQIYTPAEYASVMALGYPAPILTIYRIGDEGWQEQANFLPLRAVTMPVERGYLARGIKHPVFLHTVNRPIKGYGLYTDCLIPK